MSFFLLYRPLGIVAWLISFFGMLTSLNGLMLAASRTIFVMGRAGILPKAFCSLHKKYRTPQNALVFILVIAIIFGMLGKRAMIWLLDIAGIGNRHCLDTFYTLNVGIKKALSSS